MWSIAGVTDPSGASPVFSDGKPLTAARAGGSSRLNFPGGGVIDITDLGAQPCILAPGQPLSARDIINGIFTAKWSSYTHTNASFMNSFMMTPVTTIQEVESQYQSVEAPLRRYMNARLDVTISALFALPRVSTQDVKKLYSGQIAISNLSMDVFPAYFLQFPGNSGPVGTPLQMPIQDALAGFMALGYALSLKTFVSFTDSEENAMHYSNGILLTVSPPQDVFWDQCAYVTPLSDQSDKNKYLFSRGSWFTVDSFETVNYQGKQIIKIDRHYSLKSCVRGVLVRRGSSSGWVRVPISGSGG